jgi:hypothetical protein
MVMCVKNGGRAVASIMVMLAGAATNVYATGTQTLDYYSIKLRINLYTGCGMTKAEAKAAATRANEILKQAMVRLEVTDDCIKEDVAVPGGNDGGLTDDEGKQVQKDGQAEIAGTDGKGKGVKASVVTNPIQSNTDVNGWAVEGNPTIVMRENAAGNEKTAQTMAHEFGHVFGLRDLYDAGTENRLMHGYSADRTNTTLSETEIATIKEKAKEFGTCINKKVPPAVPAEKTPESHGAKTNGSAPVPGSEREVAFIRVNRLEPSTSYLVNFELNGVLPPLLPQPIIYHLLINADNNFGTGVNAFGRPGIDFIVRAECFGENNINYILDHPGFPSVPLTGSRFRGLKCTNDETLMPPVQPTFAPKTDFLRVNVPVSLLPFSNGEFFQMSVVTLFPPIGVTDQFDFQFDLNFHLRGPQMATANGAYQSGQPVDVTIQNLGSMQDFVLRVDDTSLGLFTTDLAGNFVGTVPMPPLPPNFYFLTAEPVVLSRGIGGTPGYATTVIDILPPPPCLGDANGDSMVTFADITTILANFGNNYLPGTGPGDSNFDGVVNFSDVTTTLANFGLPCP